MSACDMVIQRTVEPPPAKNMALSLAVLIVCVPAMYRPLMTFTVAGHYGSGNVIDAVVGLFEKGYYFFRLKVCLVSIAFPLVKLSLLFISSVSIAV